MWRALAALAALGACADDPVVDPCPAGSEGCDCDASGGCAAPLTCVLGTCECAPGDLGCPCTATNTCNAGAFCRNDRCCELGTAECNCDAGTCAGASSCLVNVCVSDGSIQGGGTCNAGRQCVGGLSCAPQIFTCRPACSQLLAPAPDCPAGEWCKPLQDPTPAWVGACLPDENCGLGCANPGDACFEVATGVEACLPGCTVTWQAGSYYDNCGSTPISPQFCSPIGAGNSERLACLDSVIGAGAAGVPCDAVTAPCEAGLMCRGGVCRTHCDTTAGGLQCQPAEQCCPAGNGTFGYCATGCS